MNTPDCIIRAIREAEIPGLEEFLYEAIFLPEGVAPPDRSIVLRPELQVYIENFGSRADDRCLVAEWDGRIVGAVWTRVMKDYGHIDDRTPSLALSLYPESRGRGIGSELLRQILSELRAAGYSQVSLSVQKANYALRMYRKAGFTVLTDHGEELLMLCRLSP